MSLFARATFLPSLAYNLIRNRFGTWNWFDRIDHRVVLGALPFHGPVTFHLYHHENIRSVVSMNENFELNLYPFISNRKEWTEVLYVRFLQLNTADIFHAPTLEQLIQGVKFIRQIPDKHPKQQNSEIEKLRNRIFNNKNPLLIHWPIRNKGQILTIEPKETNSTIHHYNDSGSTYVHCKAGRTRSATLVACYLMEQYRLNPIESVRELQRCRPQILLHTKQIEALEMYYEFMTIQKQLHQPQSEPEHSTIIHNTTTRTSN